MRVGAIFEVREDAQGESNEGIALKSDTGKPRLDLVPLEGLVPMAQVREFALQKYGADGIGAWREIADARLFAALLRHAIAYQKDPNGVDAESGLPHAYHMQANATFLAILAMERMNNHLL